MNIKWAKQHDYPKDKLGKLEEREQKCIELKASMVKDPQEDPWDFFKLSYPPNPKIPFIVECLEMLRTTKYGRGIYATQDLKPGDIIAIDKSLFQFLYPSMPENIPPYTHCCNCLKTNMMNLIPCLKMGKKFMLKFILEIFKIFTF